MSCPSIINQEPAFLNYPELKKMNVYTEVFKIDDRIGQNINMNHFGICSYFYNKIIMGCVALIRERQATERVCVTGNNNLC